MNLCCLCFRSFVSRKHVSFLWMKKYFLSAGSKDISEDCEVRTRAVGQRSSSDLNRWHTNQKEKWKRKQSVSLRLVYDSLGRRALLHSLFDTKHIMGRAGSLCWFAHGSSNSKLQFTVCSLRNKHSYSLFWKLVSWQCLHNAQHPHKPNWDGLQLQQSLRRAQPQSLND